MVFLNGYASQIIIFSEDLYKRWLYILPDTEEVVQISSAITEVCE